jgi:thiamine-phosphate diphosphorylase/hydroxyethylthiazole kinase
MDIVSARKILGPDKIIGATVSTLSQARIAVDRGADYLGIGTLYATATKKNTKEIIGINGIRRILHFLAVQDDAAARDIKTVCIGGINASNLQLVQHQLFAPDPFSQLTAPKTIDGVAIVSAIMGSSNPKASTTHLKQLFTTAPPFAPGEGSSPVFSLPSKQATLPRTLLSCIHAVSSKTPLSHNMTNLVVQNFAASVALAIGASPIMSNNGAEASDLAKLAGGLVINMGTAVPEALRNHRLAIQAYNAAGGPIVLDPVGAGATTARREALGWLMASGYFTLIKGNESEILAVAQASGLSFTSAYHAKTSSQTQQRGVDSSTSSLSLPEKAYITQRIASRERTIVLMTGTIDILSDGHTTYTIANGHEYLGMITGSGCTLGTTLSAYLAAAISPAQNQNQNNNNNNKTSTSPMARGHGPGDVLHAALAGILHFEIGAERAASLASVQGPGTFVPVFIDSLYQLRIEAVRRVESLAGRSRDEGEGAGAGEKAEEEERTGKAEGGGNGHGEGDGDGHEGDSDEVFWLEKMKVQKLDEIPDAGLLDEGLGVLDMDEEIEYGVEADADVDVDVDAEGEDQDTDLGKGEI